MNAEQKAQPGTLAAEMAEMGITISSEFVPYSKSRSVGSEHGPNLNWKVGVMWNGQTTGLAGIDYSAGQAHCPAYKGSVRMLGGHDSVDRAMAVAWECEHGKAGYVGVRGTIYSSSTKPPLEPNATDVMSSLLLDGRAIDFPTYEAFASEYGYDADSRKGEAIYRQCVEIGLKLRAIFGEERLARLRAAAEDY